MKRPLFNWHAIDWAEMSADDAARLVAVLPLAATEQHGPHLPLETDVLIAEAYLAEVGALLPADVPVSVLPVQRIGISTEHMDFAGTQTVSPDEALRNWMAIGDEVAARGVRRFVMVTSHGGNSAMMGVVAQELRARHTMLAVTTAWGRFNGADRHFSSQEVAHGIHGGAVETSIMLARYPGLVRTGNVADFTPSSLGFASRFKWLSTQRPAPFAWMAQDLHPSGAIGDATLATAAIGEALVTSGARAFCELLEDMAHFDLSHFKRP